MRIAITGAAGFIGSHTCERLVGRGHEVVGVDSFDDFLYPAEVKRQNARELERLSGDRFRLVEADICDRAAMVRVLDRVDVVCHLAALAGVRPSILDPLRYLRSNLEGLGVILETMRGAAITRLVFASSSSVYGDRGRETGGDLAQVAPFREDDPCLCPASPYAATKRSGELLCSTYRDLFGVGVYALRYFTVYGARQRPNMAIHKFVRAIANGEELVLFGDGESRRDYTFIDDIAAGTIAACERVAPGRFRLYNLGSTATTSLAQLVAGVEEVVGRPARIRRQPPEPGDVPITCADITRAERDLGYQPTVSLSDGLARFWEWYRHQPSA